MAGAISRKFMVVHLLIIALVTIFLDYSEVKCGVSVIQFR